VRTDIKLASSKVRAREDILSWLDAMYKKTHTKKQNNTKQQQQQQQKKNVERYTVKQCSDFYLYISHSYIPCYTIDAHKAGKFTSART